MRVVIAASIVGCIVGFSNTVSEDTMPTGNYCEEMCTQTAGCDQSYCKDNGLCFGLYHRGDSKCYQPGGEAIDCDDSVLEPVQCAEYPVTTCDDVCSSIEGCKESKWGTYCKTWQDPPVCFGIIVKEDGSLCFNPIDEECVGEPYPCEIAPIETTVIPETTGEPTDAPETTVGSTDVSETTSEPVDYPTNEDLAGDWCGETPLGSIKVTPEVSGAVTLFVAGQTFTAEYYLDGYEIVFTNPDEALAALLEELDSGLYALYTDEGVYVELVNVFTTTITRC
ncbi:hypothetical protein Pmar_PMAR024129 [Perkinsus marinus ATCC 50983]|uniref:Uncharacterized protein n=1 Tax=Perkinsus marinus (strain ATCC 50983 / TXsc) TaxID=423536 RepID=C5L293_PERM5|nr:hypothetical protein Pmar_PMAR024129 [Perkinsus marinus ATCC 50983]EER09105.1 hypothetical protein Pmar_PMAR024129 [Perkinsus marinus ATCC 50983]|eukprot:XP_002777289.1 hypothetical protein Pmar_PMAR024129 [Perkinsus marinus ATCC 50983]